MIVRDMQRVKHKNGSIGFNIEVELEVNLIAWAPDIESLAYLSPVVARSRMICTIGDVWTMIFPVLRHRCVWRY